MVVSVKAITSDFLFSIHYAGPLNLQGHLMKAFASIQLLCTNGSLAAGCLRIHEGQGHWVERSSFNWACAIKLDGNTAELWGALAAPPWAARRAIDELLEKIGVSELGYEINGRWIRRTKRAAQLRSFYADPR